MRPNQLSQPNTATIGESINKTTSINESRNIVGPNPLSIADVSNAPQTPGEAVDVN